MEAIQSNAAFKDVFRAWYGQDSCD
jgi:hypothetical protein